MTFLATINGLDMALFASCVGFAAWALLERGERRATERRVWRAHEHAMRDDTRWNTLAGSGADTEPRLRALAAHGCRDGGPADSSEADPRTVDDEYDLFADYADGDRS